MPHTKEEFEGAEVRMEHKVEAVEPSVGEGADPEIYKGNAAVLLDIGPDSVENAGAMGIKLAPDGHTVLIPQPSDDPNDPLNWTWRKKHAILLTVCVSGFVADFQASSGVPCLLPQSLQWGISPVHVNYAGNLNVLFVGLGGCFFMPFLFFWGRAPVLFWVVLMSTTFALGATLAPNFNTYYGMRALEGFTATAGQTAGLAFIQDIFFLHEHARKIGIWTAVALASPYLGPLFGNFIITGTGEWKSVFWLVFGMGCINLICVLVFLDESWYRRDLDLANQPARGSRMMRVIGLWQIKVHHGYFGTLQHSVQRLLAVLFKPIIIPILIYYMLTLMWAVGINQTSSILFATPASAGGYGFSQSAVSYVFFAPIIAVLLGEAFGHIFNDLIARSYVRKHGGVFVPEARLKTLYVAAFLTVPGLIIVGQVLQHHLHWVGLVFGWGMYVFGYMVVSVAVTAYALDSYAAASGEVAALISFSRNVGGFAVGYFQLAWGLKDGFDVSFGVQAAIVGCATLIVPLLHIFGARMRRKGGPLKL